MEPPSSDNPTPMNPTLSLAPPPSQTRILTLLRSPLAKTFTPDYIIQLLSRESLLKIEQFMRKTKLLKVTGFMRFFRELMPFQKGGTDGDVEFFVNYALFRLFREICSSKKKVQISFSDISSYIAEKMPNFTRQSIIQQKLLPLGLSISETHKAHIQPPEIYGQILEDRCFLTQRPIRSDRIQHLSREVGQAEYSQKFKLFFTMDKPSTIISVLDDNFETVLTLQTEQEMTKRDMVVNYIAWSDWQEKIACILGNYSISMWSKDDNYKYEVNIPLPALYLANPFTMIKYMNSMKKWITVDNRPAIYVLGNRNYQPEYMFLNQKIRKKKESERFLLAELEYVQLLCIGFQRNLFLVSLKNKEIVSEVHNFRTGITSIAFSESYQALFVSTYENFFRSYELSQFQDLMQRGKFQGHKSQISLLGTLEKKPIVFSLQQNSLLKMFDMRSYNCYQSVSVLKNIVYRQVLYLEDAICLVGSKMHVYGVQREIAFQEGQKVIYLGSLYQDFLVVSNKNIRVFDIRTGALKEVIKPIFENSETSPNIYSFYPLPQKQKLFIQSQQGECQILESKQKSLIQTWSLAPNPHTMHYDAQNDLLLQISLGTLNLFQYSNEFCQIELRRQIKNQGDRVRLCKIGLKQDLIAICYQGEDQVFFYAYQRGRIVGFLGFGGRRVVRFRNVYKGERRIYRVVDLEFWGGKNVIFLLLSDQLLILTFKRTQSSLTFFLKKSIQLYPTPLPLAPPNPPYIYPQSDLQIPLHSTSLSIFPSPSSSPTSTTTLTTTTITITITTNRANILACISFDLGQVSSIQDYIVNRDNYNPGRIGFEVHRGKLDVRNPIVVIKDICGASFGVNYYVYKEKVGEYVLSSKIGNLLALADDRQNILLFQNSNWSQIAGLINYQQTLPKLWNIFKYSQQQIKQIQFVLDFMENQERFPVGLEVKGLMEREVKPRIGLGLGAGKERGGEMITMEQLIREDRERGGLKTYRSCSLREKKIVLEKQRDERAKLQNYLQQQKLQKKQNPNPSLKTHAHKQITDTLAYLSLNHNETILKRGLIEEDIPAVRELEKKLLASVAKDEKKSIVSYRTGEDSGRGLGAGGMGGSGMAGGLGGLGMGLAKSVMELSMGNLKMTKTLSTEMYEEMTEKLGLKTYTSKNLLQKLKVQKHESIRKLKSVSKLQKLPKLDKN